MKKEKDIQLIKDDPWLSPYKDDIQRRLEKFEVKQDFIKKNFKSLYKFAGGHEYFGLTYNKKKKGWNYREWAPFAVQLSLVGDFNNWDVNANVLEMDDYGVWETFVSEKTGLTYGSKYKVHVRGNNVAENKIPAYANYVTQDPETYEFCSELVETDYKWKNESIDLSSIKSPVIYECHIGMAQEKEGTGTYLEFIKNTLPHIKKNGYNCIQIMGIHEHPYYGSFGYHVSNFFAPSSRFGTPVDLKKLVDKAHSMGIAVIMDIVHSHAVKNTTEGLNNFDGSGHHYFHDGVKGEHPQWDSKCFDYSKTEVQRFLLSNLRYWLEEFNFDGFRFDGITSMLYDNHGVGDFDHYDKYFKIGIDEDAITYLMLASKLIKKIKPDAICIAEDMSGMPGLCRSIKNGGIGFDYRLAMGVPDYWIKILKHKQDEQWNMQEVWETLLNRRWKEKTISYAESHDQALVGDKTLAFWLMDKEMYFSMSKDIDSTIIDRGLALHKMIRLLTMALAGEAYMTFMGNEFGHPEWVDFPREGNDWSFKHARRQWNLVENKDLKYEYLNNFEKAMIKLEKKYNFLGDEFTEELNIDQHNHSIAFKRGKLIFVFNFSPHNSVPDYEFYVPNKGKYKLVLNSDSTEFGGYNRIDESYVHETEMKDDAYPHLKIYNVNRCVQVFAKTK